jgi:hypothetical protein
MNIIEKIVLYLIIIIGGLVVVFHPSDIKDSSDRL